MLRTARVHPRIAHVRFGLDHVYLLSHPDLVRRLLVESGRYTTKSGGTTGARAILGDGLLTSEEPRHTEQRRLIQPAFHRRAVAGYVESMRAAALRHESAWRPGARVDMAERMSAITFDVVGEVLFGADIGAHADSVRAALADLYASYNRVFLPWFQLMMRLPTPLRRRVTGARTTLDAAVYSIIDQRTSDSGDLLATLLAGDRALARDQVMTLMLAGHETTGSALTFAWYLLAANPEAAEWLREEVDTDPGYENAHRTRAVIAEALRLYPPSWTMGRLVRQDLVLDDWTVPAGSICLVSQWSQHRDPRFWSEPLRFRPERWISDGRFDLAAPGQPRYAYFPFGAGSRMCVGETFAWTEAVIVLGTLARRWAPRLRPGYRLRLRPAITLRPDGPLPMTLDAR